MGAKVYCPMGDNIQQSYLEDYQTMSSVPAFPAEGKTKEAIYQELAALKGDDAPWKSGRVLAFTYDPGDEISEVVHNAYMSYLTENGLDPTTFPSTQRLDSEIIAMLRDLLRGDENVVGNCTSGGTESIMCAVKAARDWSRKHRPEIAQPEIIFPSTAHPAFYKACAYLGVDAVPTAFDSVSFEADVKAMRLAVTANTILLVGSAPGYAQGVIDPIEEIAALAQEKELLCHVDACVGGIQLPVMRRMGGFDLPNFDFSLPGVTSISVDMHKYGYAPKNVSSVLYRSKELRRYQIFACRRTTIYALINPTVLSSKSAGPLAGAWAILNFLGEKGYQKLYGEVMKASNAFVEGINAIDGLRVLGVPQMCLFSFTSDEFNIFELGDLMHDKGWYLQPQFSTPLSPANLHITMDSAAVPHVDAVLRDLKISVEELKQSPNPIDAAMVREQVHGILESLGDGAVDALRELAGFEGSEVPDHLAMINTMMDALPDELAEEILTDFMNDLYV